MSKHLFISLTFLFMLATPAWAQRRMKQMDADKQAQEDEARSYERTPLKDRFLYGGNFWLSFGSQYSQFYVQPLVGFKVTEKFIVGGGFTYIYWKQEYVYSNNQKITFSDNIYGLNLFARHTVFGPLFAYTEYQPMNFTSHNLLQDEKRIWTHAYYVGGGLNQSFGKSGSGAYFMLLYDLLWRDRDPNPSSFDHSFRPTPIDFRFGLFF